MSAEKILRFCASSERVSATKVVCPVCEEGTLTDHCDIHRFVRHDIFVQAESHFSVCSECGSEQASGDQISLNKLSGDKAFHDALLNLQGEPNNYG